jgi:hypothetical protein
MMLFSFASIFALFARKGPFLARPHQLFAIFYVSIPRSPIEAVGIVTCICSSLAKKNIIHSLSMHSICIQNVLSSQRLRNLRWPLGRDWMYRLRLVPSPGPAVIRPLRSTDILRKLKMKVKSGRRGHQLIRNFPLQDRRENDRHRKNANLSK